MHALPHELERTPQQAGAWMMQSAPGAETVLNGRRYLYFAGTGYLGLQGHPEVIAAAATAAQRYGLHTATSRGGFGTSPPVAEVEQRAASLLASDEAAYFVSGYAVNFAIAAGLAGAASLAFVDEHAHHSVRESTVCLTQLMRPAMAFRHRDANHLAELLRAHVRGGSRPLVLTDGVFAVSGRLAPLADYLDVLARYDGALLHVDDAHGLAVLGALGRGSLELAGVRPESINRDLDEPLAGPRVFHGATLSKAVGGHGGVVAGTRALLERLKRASGWFRGASAPAAPVAAATAKGLELAAGPSLRRQLAENVAQLRRGLADSGLDVEASPSPIVGVRLESAERMQQAHARLAADGILVTYARDYAGAGPDGMLRIAVFATHTPAMIERLLEAVRRVLSSETGL
jgi:7-keto-8-aminopelargonate synthetase-like enzyme